VTFDAGGESVCTTASPNGEGKVMRGLLLDMVLLSCAALLLVISMRSTRGINNEICSIEMV
jgi:hypothetical protein